MSKVYLIAKHDASKHNAITEHKEDKYDTFGAGSLTNDSM